MNNSISINEKNFPNADWFYLKNGNIAAVLPEPDSEKIREEEFCRRYHLFAAVYSSSEERETDKVLRFEKEYDPKAGKAMYAYVSDGNRFWVAAVGPEIVEELGKNREEIGKYLKKVLAIWKTEKIWTLQTVAVYDAASGKELDHVKNIRAYGSTDEDILRDSGLLRKYKTEIETDLYSGFKDITGVLNSVESYRTQKSESALFALKQDADYFVICKGAEKKMVCYRAADGRTHSIPVYMDRTEAEHAVFKRGGEYSLRTISIRELAGLLEKPSFSEVRLYTGEGSCTLDAQTVISRYHEI